MQELDRNDASSILKRFPSHKIELCYETELHNKVNIDTYDICIAIPLAKKYFLWFSWFPGSSSTYLFFMEIGKDRKIYRIHRSINSFSWVERGTIFYGCYVDENKEYIIEDVIQYQGLFVGGEYQYGQKLDILREFLTSHFEEVNRVLQIRMPLLKHVKNPTTELVYGKLCEYVDKHFIEHANYRIHHIALHCCREKKPCLNYVYQKKPMDLESIREKEDNWIKSLLVKTNTVYHIQPFHFHYQKDIYRGKACFIVRPEIQADVYVLFLRQTSPTQKKEIAIDIAYIPDRKTSRMMNQLFRKIRENQHLDYGEESEDEDDFENLSPDKYVNMNAVYTMECRFYPKFKKWVPVKVVHEHWRTPRLSEL